MRMFQDLQFAMRVMLSRPTSALLMVIALLAHVRSALRTARLDPMNALGFEQRKPR